MLRTQSVTHDIVDQFHDSGYFIMHDFFDRTVLQHARDGIMPLVDRCAEQLVAEGKIPGPMADASFETRLARLYAGCKDNAPHIFRRELHLQGMFDIFFHPGLLNAVERILGSEIRLYPNYSVRPKLPDHPQTLVLWHQDGGYTQNVHLDGQHGERAVEVLRMVNAWAPLVPTRETNGCMQFIPGSHKLGLAPHEGRQYYLEISPDAMAPHLEKAVSIELDPGDVVLFHNMLFHQGLPNRSDKVRWSMDWRYQDATQSTLRQDKGHLARSRIRPDSVVHNEQEWLNLTFR
ncbi:MAG: phytanoyl-CoA dioxygenase family protein [Gemmatimonadota bacterium]|nr:phytanoyl-CoA dioxygenase family protein [Gemmatimonadota bacterium]